MVNFLLEDLDRVEDGLQSLMTWSDHESVLNALPDDPYLRSVADYSPSDEVAWRGDLSSYTLSSGPVSSPWSTSSLDLGMESLISPLPSECGSPSPGPEPSPARFFVFPPPAHLMMNTPDVPSPSAPYFRHYPGRS